jgi:hypothetical protein
MRGWLNVILNSSEEPVTEKVTAAATVTGLLVRNE